MNGGSLELLLEQLKTLTVKTLKTTIRKKFDKLEGTSPLFLTTRTSTLFNCCCSKKTTTLVGYYEKCEDKIAIYAFNTSTEPIDVYCSKEAASTASMFSNAVDAPTLGSPVGGTETSPSQQGTNSRQMAAGGLSNDPVHNTHSPTEEQGQSPGRTRENTSALAIGSSRRNDQPILPPGFQLEDIIDKNRMNYRRYLLHIAKNLTNNEWKVLGEALKIPDLEQIENDYSGVKEQAYQMLIKWTVCKSTPTLAILIGALNRTGQRQLVDEISNYLGDNIGQIQGGTPVQDFQQDIISDIQDDWKFIGRYLGLKESVIHGIKERYREPYERARQMLTKWKKANGNEATFQVLMVALQSVGKENVVRRLQGLAS